ARRDLADILLILGVDVGSSDADVVGVVIQQTGGARSTGRGVDASEERDSVGASEPCTAPLAKLVVVKFIDVRAGPGGRNRAVLAHILLDVGMHNRDIVAETLGGSGGCRGLASRNP